MAFKWTRWIFADSITNKAKYLLAKLDGGLFSMHDENENDIPFRSFIIDILYADLLALKGSWAVGQKYRIIDFCTRHRIRGTFHTDSTDYVPGKNDLQYNYDTIDPITLLPIPANMLPVSEPLIVKATSADTLDKVAYSDMYPHDIIHYELEDSSAASQDCDRWESDRGRIIYRKDTLLHITCHFDYRNVVHYVASKAGGSGIFDMDWRQDTSSLFDRKLVKLFDFDIYGTVNGSGDQRIKAIHIEPCMGGNIPCIWISGEAQKVRLEFGAESYIFDTPFMSDVYMGSCGMARINTDNNVRRLTIGSGATFECNQKLTACTSEIFALTLEPIAEVYSNFGFYKVTMYPNIDGWYLTYDISNEVRGVNHLDGDYVVVKTANGGNRVVSEVDLVELRAPTYKDSNDVIQPDINTASSQRAVFITTDPVTNVPIIDLSNSRVINSSGVEVPSGTTPLAPYVVGSQGESILYARNDETSYVVVDNRLPMNRPVMLLGNDNTSMHVCYGTKGTYASVAYNGDVPFLPTTTFNGYDVLDDWFTELVCVGYPVTVFTGPDSSLTINGGFNARRIVNNINSKALIGTLTPTAGNEMLQVAGDMSITDNRAPNDTALSISANSARMVKLLSLDPSSTATGYFGMGHSGNYIDCMLFQINNSAVMYIYETGIVYNKFATFTDGLELQRGGAIPYQLGINVFNQVHGDGATSVLNLTPWYTDSGDACIHFNVATVGPQWALGLDNSDGDKFKLTYGSSDSTPSHGIKCFTVNPDGTLMLGTDTPTSGAEKLQVRGTASFGDGTNCTKTEADGTIVFDGTATVWNDAFVDGLSLFGGATDGAVPSVIGATTIFAPLFIDAAIKSCHGSIEIPHDYKEGTALLLHIHFIPTTTMVGNVRWGVEWIVANVNGTFGAATTSEIDIAAGGVALAHKVVDVVTISGTGRKISDVIHFRVFRNGTHANDTFTGNAFLSRIAVHYECDMVGSRSTTTKA